MKPVKNKKTDVPIDNKFGERLKEFRTARDISQKQMADEIEISPSLLSAYENQKPGNTKNPSILTAIKIATKYGVSIDWLCGLSDEEKTIKVTNYIDVFSRFFDISKKIYLNIELCDGIIGEEEIKIEFSDPVLTDFFRAWERAKSLYDDNLIDTIMYDDLVKGLFKRYDKKIPDSAKCDGTYES
ncbi:helix-turn-helix transcriptional regulator [Acetobacterium sp.]|uniref:helix-turn-helix domain-containing protein n=1 Tax=Acetobacterium sp. TaxID=1872094 RepID=UPI002F402C3D